MFFGDGSHLLFDLPTTVLLDLYLIVNLPVLMLQDCDFLQERAFLIFIGFLLLCNGGLDGGDFSLDSRCELF